jgi:hypothetical protein
MGVRGDAKDYDTAQSIVAQVMDAVPSGGYLALGDQNDTIPDLDVIVGGYKQTGAVASVPPPAESQFDRPPTACHEGPLSTPHCHRSARHLIRCRTA